MKSFNFGGDREDIGPFVSASLPIVSFATRRQYDGDAMLPDCVTKATRHRIALATPSSKHGT